MTCSMSRKGNCWDNAPTESWFNSFRNERVHSVRYASHAEMKAETFEHIERGYYSPNIRIKEMADAESIFVY